MNLAAQRCYNHPDREVAVRCPECGRFYCRECASEFQDRFLCKICLEALRVKKKRAYPNLLARLRRGAGLVIGLTLCWFLFYSLAQVIFSMPSHFHSGLIHYEEKSE